jgi:HSP20 family protein
MVEAVSKLPVKTGEKKPERAGVLGEWRPFDTLRREIDQLFDNIQVGSWRAPFARTVFDTEPFWRGEISWGKSPAADVTETDKGYEITAELPGLDESDVDVKFVDGTLTIKGEKKEEKEERKKDYYVSERHFGSFQRSFRVPKGVVADKIEASFKNGVLTVVMPKTPEAQKAEKKIAVKKA